MDRNLIPVTNDELALAILLAVLLLTVTALLLPRLTRSARSR